MRSLTALVLCAFPAFAQSPPGGVAAQVFTLDPAHSTVGFEVHHMGFSTYAASFDAVAGTLHLDPADPASAGLTVTIDAASLDLPAPPEGFRDTILGLGWLDADAYPEITFVSDSVRLTGPTTADIDGTLTIAGTAAPATIAATFNGGYDGKPYEPAARFGFSGRARILRSAYGIDAGLPPPGTDFGVGDEVEIRIETEWTGTPGG